jgi:hypothetical protein
MPGMRSFQPACRSGAPPKLLNLVTSHKFYRNWKAESTEDGARVLLPSWFLWGALEDGADRSGVSDKCVADEFENLVIGAIGVSNSDLFAGFPSPLPILDERRQVGWSHGQRNEKSRVLPKGPGPAGQRDCRQNLDELLPLCSTTSRLSRGKKPIGEELMNSRSRTT